MISIVVTRRLLLAALFLLWPTGVKGEVVTKAVEYQQGDITLEGFLAWDNAQTGPRPGVLVVHEWTGLNDYTRSRCRQLAELGYVAFAADIYGQGVRPQSREEAAKQAGIYYSDRALMRARVRAGLDILRANEMCDTTRVAAIGYCFGGTVVIELARSGAPINGIVTFHGGLNAPDTALPNDIGCKVLVCHGAVDPHVGFDKVEAFLSEMKRYGTDFQFIAYSGAVHAFTNPEAGDDPSTGVAYNAEADRRSWAHMKMFFGELFD